MKCAPSATNTCVNCCGTLLHTTLTLEASRTVPQDWLMMSLRAWTLGSLLALVTASTADHT